MRTHVAVVLVLVAGLAACGGKRNAVVHMSGMTPNTRLDKDTRKVTTACPGCRKYQGDVDRCPVKKTCDTPIGWEASYDCAFCKGSGQCNACYMMEGKGGKCFYCKGEGVLPYKGNSSICRACEGNKLCAICKGDQKCDFCKGAGKLDKARVQELAKAANAGGGGDPGAGTKEEKPADKPADKPAEEKKPEEPKKE